ncbi:MAG: methylase, partial [Dehalococcoidia bacterium]|nr:methylase [Dehalococcoidia bacterium]
ERIINASSNEGDIVLDPFCGCGTAVVAAQKLNRRWIGIDVTILAVNEMKDWLQEAFPELKGKYRVVGEPTTLTEARSMVPPDASLETRYQFQYWALGLVGARPASDSRKKGADAGVDGYFSLVHGSDGKKETYIQVIVQVKSGHVGANLIRDLAGTVGDDKLGIFITLEEPTEPMKAAALAAGLYHNPLMNTHHPRIQIMTIAELLEGKSPNLPPHRPGWERGAHIGQNVRQGTLT